MAEVCSTVAPSDSVLVAVCSIELLIWVMEVEVSSTELASDSVLPATRPIWEAISSIELDVSALDIGDSVTVADLVAPVFELDGDTPLHTALTRMRETANHLALVHTGQGAAVATMADVLAYLFPRTTAGGQGSQGAPVPGGR